MQCYNMRQPLYEMCSLSDLKLNIVHVKLYILRKNTADTNVPQIITLHDRSIVIIDSLCYSRLYKPFQQQVRFQVHALSGPEAVVTGNNGFVKNAVTRVETCLTASYSRLIKVKAPRPALIRC